jgi:membrane protease YdiL (CAAX protease family)
MTNGKTNAAESGSGAPPSRVYPALGLNGRPVPSDSDRRRVLLELGIILLLTVVYLAQMGPHRPGLLDVGMALLGLGLLIVGWKRSKRLWGEPTSPAFDRWPRCLFLMAAVTVPPLLLFAGIAAFAENGFSRFIQPHFFLALLIYLPWALLQQTLFQFYLQGRLQVILPYAPAWLIAVFNGIFYGAVHLPDWPLTLLTMVGGIIWSYSYHRDRYLLPIAISHALVGSTYFYWVMGSDPAAKHLLSLFGAQ